MFEKCFVILDLVWDLGEKEKVQLFQRLPDIRKEFKQTLTLDFSNQLFSLLGPTKSEYNGSAVSKVQMSLT